MRALDELLGVDVLQRGADDPALLEQPGLGQPQQPGQQLALGQVAGRTEEHDDVRGGHPVDARAHKLPRYYALAERRQRAQQPLGLPPRLGVLVVDVGVHGDPAAGAQPVGAVAGGGERPDDHAEVGAAVGGEPAERAGVRPPRRVLDLGDHLHRAQLGRAGHRAGREQRAQRPDRRDVVAQPAADRGDQLVHGRVGLDRQQRRHLDAADLADHGQVVAEQVGDHQVLGAEPRLGRQRAPQLLVLLGRGAARGGALDRLGLDRAVARPRPG